MLDCIGLERNESVQSWVLLRNGGRLASGCRCRHTLLTPQQPFAASEFRVWKKLCLELFTDGSLFFLSLFFPIHPRIVVLLAFLSWSKVDLFNIYKTWGSEAGNRAGT